MTTEHRHPRCVPPSGGAPIDTAVIADLRREVGDLKLQHEADVAEAAATIATLQAALDALRCGDLGPYFGGRLSPERAAAFRLHLATCAACEAGLLDLMQLEASLTDARPGPTRER